MTYKPGDEVVLKAGVPDHPRAGGPKVSNGSGDD
jgi:hypothetical protein